MKPILEVRNIGKRYRIRHQHGSYLSLRERILDLFRSNGATHEDFWALKDVSFDVQPGESLGVIGRNGAGKSTLLKILSRITPPTTGKFVGRGRIASMLEVGTGFHPELTGRENVFLNGSLLGMKRKEIDRKFDEIVDFSGVEKFLDTALKHYSSGMQLRLAFAVAAFLEPEILVIDEVLAVGDAEFQKKCLGKMQSLSEIEGRTVLFVSHQIDSVSRLCNRVIVMEGGEVSFNGSAAEGISSYRRGSGGVSGYYAWEDHLRAPGTNGIRLIEVGISNENPEAIDVRKPVTIFFSYKVLDDEITFTHGLNIHNDAGVHVLSSHDVNTGKKRPLFKKGVYTAEVVLPPNFLAEGHYYVSVAIMNYDPYQVLIHEKEVVMFNVIDSMEGDSARGVYGGHFPGTVRPILDWKQYSKT